jgi:hypothetical protein
LLLGLDDRSERRYSRYPANRTPRRHQGRHAWGEPEFVAHPRDYCQARPCVV